MSTIIKKSRVEVRELTREEFMASAIARGDDGAREPVAKSVRLLEDRGHVHALELTCSCGDVTVIELEYPPAPTEAETPAQEETI
jgi:hypothetical protein